MPLSQLTCEGGWGFISFHDTASPAFRLGVLARPVVPVAVKPVLRPIVDVDRLGLVVVKGPIMQSIELNA
jgi:hypothetical protein